MSFAKISWPWQSNTIGVRLTIWGTVDTLLVSILLCAVLYAGIFISLRRQIDIFLEGEVHELRSTLAEHPGNSAKAQEDLRREAGSRTRHDLYFRLLDEHGHALVTSEPRDPLPDPWTYAPVGEMSPETSFFETVDAK